MPLIGASSSCFFCQGKRDLQVRGLASASATGSVSTSFRDAFRSKGAFPERQLLGRSWLSLCCSQSQAGQRSGWGLEQLLQQGKRLDDVQCFSQVDTAVLK